MDEIKNISRMDLEKQLEKIREQLSRDLPARLLGGCLAGVEDGFWNGMRLLEKNGIIKLVD